MKLGFCECVCVCVAKYTVPIIVQGGTIGVVFPSILLLVETIIRVRNNGKWHKIDCLMNVHLAFQQVQVCVILTIIGEIMMSLCIFNCLIFGSLE